MTPFEADCGLTPNNPLFMFSAAASKYSRGHRVINTLEDFLNQMRDSWESAITALIIAQDNQKSDYDSKRRYDEFRVGDTVYMSSQRLRDGTMIQWGSKSQDMADKFQPKYLGPFKILSKISSHAYKLDLPSSFKIHPVIHIRYLAREKTSEKFLKRNEGIRPPPIIVNEVPQFLVDKIVKKRIRKFGKGFQTQYLVQWQGYPPEENTWEPISSFQDFPEILQAFEANNSLIEVSSVFVVTMPTEKYLF